MSNAEDSQVQREQTLRDEIKTRMSTAEISDIKIDNGADATKPFSYTFHVRVPGYAQRTGKRLFFQPSIFRHGVAPVFATASRKQSIYFHYAWSENDQIAIELPAGYALDSPDQPTPFAAGDISQYKIKMAISNDGHMLTVRREFFFGGGGNILFPDKTYDQLKALFDALNKNDEHTLTLKQTAASN